MKTLDNSKLDPGADVPVVNAVPVAPRKPEPVRAEVIPVRPAFSNAETAVVFFLRQFRVLLGASRLYQRNHPRLVEILASTEQQLRIALAARSPLVIAVDANGMLLPRQESSTAEFLHDPRGELRALAEELLRSGICSFLFTHPINVGELDSLAHEISRVPRSGTPGDTASRKLWDAWLKNNGVIGIRINIPTERRDSLLLASLMSSVLAYDDAAQHSSHSRAVRSMPEANFEQVADTVRALKKLAPPDDPEMQPTTEDVARRFHSIVSKSDPFSISLMVYGITNVKPREGETLLPYLERLTDELLLAFLKQEFNAGRASPAALVPLLVRLDRERGQPDNTGNSRFGGSQHDEVRVSNLCEKFWNAQPARVKAKTLRGENSWCVPPAVVARFLEPLAAAAEKKKSDAAARAGRTVLLTYARSLESEENKARRAVATGLSEIAPQLERLWPHPSVADFGRGVVQALLVETSPGIAGLLSALVEKLARAALLKREYAEFERILEALEAAPRDEEHAHVATLIARILNDEQWLYLVDEALSSQPLNPSVPRLLKRCPDRLLDRLGLLLTAVNGLNSLPAMVRLIHATGEPVLGALETRLFEARRQRVATSIHLLASADPKRLAGALPKALASWEWSLQDLAATELMKWTNPPVVTATAQAFLATLAEAHAMVVPCMIDHLGIAHETAAVPTLLRIAVGEHAHMRDIFFRIKAIEALGRMRVPEAAAPLLNMVRLRNGLAHDEPAALRSAAEETLALLENGAPSSRARGVDAARLKPGAANSRTRRYFRARLQPPMQAAILGARGGSARVRVLALGGAFLETDQRLAVGDTMQLEIKNGLRKIQSTAVVRNVTATGAGVEFVHMNARDRERLRRLLAQLLK
ncbi:MAG TPA: HEAT repeat domain-containing protein [Candidatus Acidoferrales bacterium]|nr:HEAT repeat domain-containing protein [Candidatus Acidoferrales bacterium]